MNIPGTSIYYRKKERIGKRKQRIQENIEAEIIRLSGERTTYGYRRMLALLRNSGIHVYIKTVRRIMRRNKLALSYAKDKNRTRRKELMKPDSINGIRKKDIHYVSTVHDGMVYLMSINDC
ncbi:MAG TPA: transposase [Ferroplasma sp.]|jgi:transposase InsO family protein|nr:transposase [Ferroplasma sp.]